jgi:hypothetical protein
MMHLIYALLAAGTALTNSVTHTVLASYELPANHLQPGKVYRLQAAAIATATNSTDTLRVRLLVGPATLTGTLVWDGTAIDVADNDKIALDLTFTVRNVGSAAIVIVTGLCTIEGAEGTVTARLAFEQLSLDSTVAQKIELTGLWSVASASNSCRADQFVLTELV